MFRDSHDQRIAPSVWEPVHHPGCIKCRDCDVLNAAHRRLEALARRPYRDYWSQVHRDSDCPRGPLGVAAGCSICIECARTFDAAETASEAWFAHAQTHPYEWHLVRNGSEWQRTGHPTLAPIRAAAQARNASYAADQIRLEALRPALNTAIETLIAAYAGHDSAGYVIYSARSKSHCALSEIEGTIRSLTQQADWRIERDAEMRARGIRKSFSISALFARDGQSCRLCGITEAIRPVMDHVVPWAQGGFDGWANLQIACRQCNAAKSDSWAGSLDNSRLAEALAASPTYTGSVRNGTQLASWANRELFLRHLRDRGDEVVLIES